MKRQSILNLKPRPKKYRCTVIQYDDHAELNFYGLPGAIEPLTIRSPKAIGTYNKLMMQIRRERGIDWPMIDWTWLDKDGNEMKWGCT